MDSETIISKNRRSKEIISKEPKYQFKENPSGRRSFSTNQYLRGIPTITIMAITENKSEKVFTVQRISVLLKELKEQYKVSAKTLSVIVYANLLREPFIQMQEIKVN